MENNNLNIVKLFEKNPLTRLTKTYESKLINKIKNTFSDSQQQLFVGSFYLYLNYNSKTEFVVDFDNVWKWVGFSRKDHAKTLLEKHFTNNIDYNITKTASATSGAVLKTVNGGQNKETIMLTINTFKKFCLKANTKKADEIHEYYIKLEELLQETLNEETEELRIQLENTNNEKLKLEQDNIDLKKKLTKKYNDKKYPEGNCIYVLSNQLFPNYFKVGISKKFDTRLNSYDSLCPIDHDVLYFRLAYCNEEIEKIIKKIFSDKIVQTNKEEWFKLDDGNILIDAVKNVCDTIDLILPRQTDSNTEILNKNTRELKNPFLLPEKECTACKKVKSLESFNYASEHTDGRENRCKNCAKILQQKYIENKRETEEIPIEKECTSCKKILPLDDYYVDNEKFDKRGTKCKKCFLEVRKANRNYIEISEYCCSNCKITKPIDDFHKLSSSHTGHKYSCKICELKKAKERYSQKRVLELEINPAENTPDDKSEDRKQKQKESYERRINTKIECPCGSITNLAQQSKHEKTKKHLKYLESL
jgi:phage anti-repressor protein